ncbi:unnamed protein product [Paramecium primaurelia]|uniref:Peptidase M14 domain-containing protein n=1 Tax=Paramecium primaurelia TaxID=5886 RepID=A0A8S1LPA1_PARPR|nr:unnamed protein product [Paramecium primaurelia]
MKIAIIVLLSLSLVFATKFSSKYHTTAEINEELESLSRSCSFLSLSNASDSPLIKEVNINRNQNKKYRAYILFGEHPRELISPESGIHFLNDLCFEKTDPKNKQILDDFELRMILNANPLSRQKVEGGEYCLRENENGVDINRNYDAHWEKVQDDVRQVTSGPNPFSEPETRAVRDSLKAFNPDIFLTVHSGTLGMFTPHAYSTDAAEQNEDKMMDILNDISGKYCPSCDVGVASQAIGYLAPGSCVDYAYDELKIRYSFAFEIYHGSINLEEQLKSRTHSSFLQLTGQQQSTKNRKFEHNNNHSCFLQTSSKYDMSKEECFDYFNPDSSQYDWYVQNWTEAYQEMLLKLVQEEQQS